MKMGVIGTGAVGATLGRRWVELGHEVVWGSRRPGSERVAALVRGCGGGCRATDIAGAAAATDVLLLAAPWFATRDIVAACAPALEGKVLLDCINPLLPDMSGLERIPAGSTAQEIASWAPGARVVKIFNSIGYKVMENPRFGASRAAALYCGDEGVAKAIAAGIAAELGFDPVDAGPLSRARLLEEMAMLWIRLAFTQHRGVEFAFALLQR